jgi:uncharacterized membrane protein YbhN (UPF0104 family)
VTLAGGIGCYRRSRRPPRRTLDAPWDRGPEPGHGVDERTAREETRLTGARRLGLALSGRARWAAALASLAILVGMVLTADPSAALEAVEGRELAPIALAVALYLANGVAKALRWWVLLRAAGVRRRFGEAYRAFLVGMAFNNLLPTGLAGEPVRIVRLEGRVTPAAAGATTADRMLDAAALAVAAGAGIPVLAGADRGAVVPTVAALVALALAVAGAAALAWRRWELRAVARRPAAVLTAVAMTLPIQANDAVRLVLIAGVYGVELGSLRALAIVALGTVASLLTVLGGGAGLAVTVGALLGASGAGPTAAVATSLVFVATSTWLSYPLGALAGLVRTRPSPARTEETWT